MIPIELALLIENHPLHHHHCCQRLTYTSGNYEEPFQFYFFFSQMVKNFKVS